ncbi:MAG: dehydrogenase [Verrucomicrobiales bacterium]|nr:dehydrogenase [Verrucomicrobiales bacterium]
MNSSVHRQQPVISPHISSAPAPGYVLPGTAVPGFSRVLVIDGHPSAGSFGEALALSYVEGAQRAGMVVRTVKVRDLKFDPVERNQRPEEDIEKFQDDLLWSHHVVMIFPTWWGSAPALLKGLLDRALRPGFAFELREDGPADGLLAGRTAELITTMDTPRWIYRFLLGSPGIRALKGATLGFCGIKRVGVTLLGPIHESTPAQRQTWLKQTAVQAADCGRRYHSGAWPVTRRWLRAARLPFYPFPLMVFAAGAGAAAGARGWLDWRVMVIGAAGVALTEFITVLTNDLHDVETDRRNQNHGPFTGGARVVVDQTLTPRDLCRGRLVAGAVLATLPVCYLLTGAAGGGALLGIGLTGLALGMAYTVPPVRLSWRTWGEVDVAVTHGLIVALAGYVSQGGRWTDPEPWKMGTLIFFAVLPSIILAGFPDAGADAAAGKQTVVVRFGRERAVWLAMGGTGMAMLLFLLNRGLHDFASAFLVTGVMAHGGYLIHRLQEYRNDGLRSGRINGLLFLALTFMLWFAVEALLRYF